MNPRIFGAMIMEADRLSRVRGVATVFAEARKTVKCEIFEIANWPVSMDSDRKMAQWYYSKNGTQLGPVAVEELRSKLSSGEVSPADLVWKDGMSDWQPAGKIADLAISSMGLQSPMQAPPTGGVQSPYSPPVSAPGPLRHGAPIPNYLWQSIVVTLLCCWPVGIPAIVYAAKVDGLAARGDIPGAMAASANAKKWCFISLGLGLAFGIIVFALSFAGAISGAQG
jgi:hypothetical protein